MASYFKPPSTEVLHLCAVCSAQLLSCEARSFNVLVHKPGHGLPNIAVRQALFMLGIRIPDEMKLRDQYTISWYIISSGNWMVVRSLKSI